MYFSSAGALATRFSSETRDFGDLTRLDARDIAVPPTQLDLPGADGRLLPLTDRAGLEMLPVNFAPGGSEMAGCYWAAPQELENCSAPDPVKPSVQELVAGLVKGSLLEKFLRGSSLAMPAKIALVKYAFHGEVCTATHLYEDVKKELETSLEGQPRDTVYAARAELKRQLVTILVACLPKERQADALARYDALVPFQTTHYEDFLVKSRQLFSSFLASPAATPAKLSANSKSIAASIEYPGMVFLDVHCMKNYLPRVVEKLIELSDCCRQSQGSSRAQASALRKELEDDLDQYGAKCRAFKRSDDHIRTSLQRMLEKMSDLTPAARDYMQELIRQV